MDSFNRNNREPDTENAIARLKELQREFNDRAEDYRRLAATATEALQALEAAKKKEDEHAKNRFRDRIAERASYIKGLLAHEKHPHAFSVFVDHTGSMTQKPFYAALDGAAVLAKAADAQITLWGSMYEVRPVKGDALDPTVREGFIKRGASSDFRPVADEMIKQAALNRENGKPSHFVIIGDGEFSDYPAAKAQLEKLLKGRYRATVDFVILGRAGTGMEFLAENLEKSFPGKVNHHIVGGPAYWQGTEEDLSKEVQETVATAATQRVRPARSPKPGATAQP